MTHTSRTYGEEDTLDAVSLSPLHEWSGTASLLQNAGAVLEAVVKRAEKEWARTISKDAALDLLKVLAQGPVHNGIHAAVLNDSHLLIFQYGGLWYAPHERWIIEQFYVRIGKGSHKDSLLAIDALARNLGATGVIMGTSLAKNDEALGRLLAGSGYSPMSQQHYKHY